MHTLYHSSLYTNVPAGSYWETIGAPDPKHATPLQGDVVVDVAVIGGGYTGLSAALHLARDHQIDVCVLDAGHMGWGASGRNGGFGCFPATKLDLKALIARYGLEETQRFFTSQLDGLELVRSLCRAEGIQCDLTGDANLEVAHKPGRLDGLKEYAEALTRHFGIPTEVFDAQAFAETAYDSSEQYGGIRIGVGFGLHPMKFALGLADAARNRGAALYSMSEVRRWFRQGSVHVLTTAQGTVKARRVVMATNGYTREGMHEGFDRRLLPAVSNIITTRPLTADDLAAQRWTTLNPVINTRKLLFYFRLLPDNRFLFGARGDTRGTDRAGAKTREWMTQRLHQVFPHWRDVPISHFWRGLVCMTRKRVPSIGRLAEDSTVYYGFGYHANGVNTAPWAGKQIADMIASGDDGADRIPVVYRGMPNQFPLASLRLWYLRSAYQYYKLTDALL